MTPSALDTSFHSLFGPIDVLSSTRKTISKRPSKAMSRSCSCRDRLLVTAGWTAGALVIPRSLCEGAFLGLSISWFKTSRPTSFARLAIYRRLDSTCLDPFEYLVREGEDREPDRTRSTLDDLLESLPGTLSAVTIWKFSEKLLPGRSV